MGPRSRPPPVFYRTSLGTLLLRALELNRGKGRRDLRTQTKIERGAMYCSNEEGPNEVHANENYEYGQSLVPLLRINMIEQAVAENKPR